MIINIVYVPEGKVGNGNHLHRSVFLQQISVDHRVLALLQRLLITLPSGRAKVLPVQLW